MKALAPLALLLGACLPPSVPTPRAEARAALAAVAVGVKVADVACAERAMANKDPVLAESCVEDYGVARRALLAADLALDEGQMGRAGCLAAPAAGALASMSSRVATKRPPAVEDALVMAGRLAAMLPCTTDGGAQ